LLDVHKLARRVGRQGVDDLLDDAAYVAPTYRAVPVVVLQVRLILALKQKQTYKMQEQQQKKQLQGKPASIEVSCSLGAKIHFFVQLGQPERAWPAARACSLPEPPARCIRTSKNSQQRWDALDLGRSSAAGARV
jgi:hypothetical protein